MTSKEWLEGYRAGYNDHARGQAFAYQMYGIRSGGTMSEGLFDMPVSPETEKAHACAGDACGVCHPNLANTRPKKIARRSDPRTSKDAAAAVAYRTGSQKHLLLIQYLAFGALTDEEASDYASLKAGWKRCSDLRNEGMIEDTGETRVSSTSQMRQMVCRITDRGVALLASMKGNDVPSSDSPVPVPRRECPECGTTTCSRRPGYPYCYGSQP